MKNRELHSSMFRRVFFKIFLLCFKTWLPKRMSTIFQSDCQKNFLNLNAFSSKFFQASSLLCRSSGNVRRSSLLAVLVETKDLIERMNNMTRYKNFASQRGEYRHQSLCRIYWNPGGKRQMFFSERQEGSLSTWNVRWQACLEKAQTYGCRSSISMDFLSYRSFVLEVESDQNYPQNTLTLSLIDHRCETSCRGGGGSILVHDPKDSPQDRSDYHKKICFFESNALTQIIITPRITTTEESLKKIEASK